MNGKQSSRANKGLKFQPDENRPTCRNAAKNKFAFKIYDLKFMNLSDFNPLNAKFRYIILKDEYENAYRIISSRF
jgi:hypothetical protein